MVYCAAEAGLNQPAKSDIAFPHQVELKANLDEVKANLRGLKNKPGTTQPADVTNYIRKKPGYSNNVVMTYALTQKNQKFYVRINLVQRHPVEELVAELKLRKIISKEQVLREMKNRADDTDLVATSSVMYVDDILHSTSGDVEQIVIEPDGTWSGPKDDENGAAGGVTPASYNDYDDEELKEEEEEDDDDDDLIEIKEPGVPIVKRESLPSRGLTLQRTPVQSREPSTASSIARLSTNKRPAAQVIDLTGSDDEEESPVRPTKRPALNVFSRSLPRPGFRGSYNGGTVNGKVNSYGSQHSPESSGRNGVYDT
ncbi:MIZ zinc finger protein [Aspergillus affinis]|uniref:MIZ zinc finger protein n=1 Tax=Aspergillus affinis TaxID=1070780 RepID=UPI0022FEC1DC|nr:MIZ zinc finger protein [Aspergillus affinis]KAI9040882.1 MIZ zinc finger protein [Aspergillus affinis]